jgi:transposase-like protein
MRPRCREAEITEQTHYRWRKEYGGMKTERAKRLKELEQENVKLERPVAELSLDNEILRDIARGDAVEGDLRSHPVN